MQHAHQCWLVSSIVGKRDWWRRHCRGAYSSVRRVQKCEESTEAWGYWGAKRRSSHGGQWTNVANLWIHFCTHTAAICYFCSMVRAFWSCWMFWRQYYAIIYIFLRWPQHFASMSVCQAGPDEEILFPSHRVCNFSAHPKLLCASVSCWWSHILSQHEKHKLSVWGQKIVCESLGPNDSPSLRPPPLPRSFRSVLHCLPCCTSSAPLSDP